MPYPTTLYEVPGPRPGPSHAHPRAHALREARDRLGLRGPSPEGPRLALYYEWAHVMGPLYRRLDPPGAYATARPVGPGRWILEVIRYDPFWP